MRMNMVEDLGAPLAVVGVDMLTLELAPAYNEYADYAMTGLGYAGAILGFGGNFLKEIGKISLPLTARAIRERVKGGVGTRVTASRYALRSNSGIRQTVVPEYGDVKIS